MAIGLYSSKIISTSSFCVRMPLQFQDIIVEGFSIPHLLLLLFDGDDMVKVVKFGLAGMRKA